MYVGPRRSETNAGLYPGFDLGSESEWMVQQGRLSLSVSLPLLQSMVFDGLGYNGTASLTGPPTSTRWTGRWAV
ncbi:hypothetical protein CTA1_4278 [Colletotrichum tanaceti]|uniref:Uncharacterized protein n=1 Tax=Colletotrichum tanaceti TaxID=1306861 RepID=A0A4U6X5F6_9PEZI|nr:hypothetical protein CTA1_4278 [Colletotrichum tanaceti]